MTKPAMLTLDEKLDEALKETFPASDAFFLSPAPSNLGLAPQPSMNNLSRNHS